MLFSEAIGGHPFRYHACKFNELGVIGGACLRL